MKKTIVLVAIITAAGLTIWQMMAQKPEKRALSVSTPHEALSDTPAIAVINERRNGAVLSTGVDMFKPDSPSESTLQSGQEHENDSIVWQLSEDAENVLNEEGFLPSDLKNAAFIKVDTKELRSVEVGDYLDLYIPQIGGSYTGEVDYIQVHPNGDRTVEAYIPGAGTLYSAVITLGENALYATLGTQADVYIMEGNGEYAWIASKSDLVSHHSTSHKDGVVPTESVQSIAEDDPFAINVKESPESKNNNQE